MSTSVGEKNGVVIRKQPLPVTVHAKPVIGDSVQENYRVAIWVQRLYEPAAQSRTVQSCEVDTAKLLGCSICSRFSVGLFKLSYRMGGGM